MKLNYCPECGNHLEVKKENNREQLFCSACDKFVYQNPVPVVAGLIQNQKKEILLIKRGIEPCRGSWALPSGFMELDETPQQCVLREIKEETNLDCKIVHLLGVYQQKGWRYKSIIVIAYILEPIGGKPEACDDADELQYIPYKSLPQIPFKSHRKIIRDYFVNSNTYIKKLFDS